MIWDQGTGGLDMDTGFTGAVEVVGREVVVKGLGERCRYRRDRVVVWGMGQGGCVGLAVAAALEGVGVERYDVKIKQDGSQVRALGGVISLGGVLPAEVTTNYQVSSLPNKKQKCTTPVLLVGGSARSALTDTEIERTKEVFGDVTVHRWKRAEDGMPKNREEMLPIMQFLARVLKAKAPDGTIEVI